MISIFIIINSIINYDRKEKYGECDFYSYDEFLRTIDCADIFNSNPAGTKYKVSFDLKTQKPGSLIIYQQNGENYRYTWSPYPVITTSQEYEHYEVEIEPILINAYVENAYLSFYGEYGTGVIPSIKNLIIEFIE